MATEARDRWTDHTSGDELPADANRGGEASGGKRAPRPAAYRGGAPTMRKRVQLNPKMFTCAPAGRWRACDARDVPTPLVMWPWFICTFPKRIIRHGCHTVTHLTTLPSTLTSHHALHTFFPPLHSYRWRVQERGGWCIERRTKTHEHRRYHQVS